MDRIKKQLNAIGYRLGTPEGIECITTLVVLHRERAVIFPSCGLRFTQSGDRMYVIDGAIARRITRITPREEVAVTTKERTSKRKPSRFIRRAA